MKHILSILTVLTFLALMAGGAFAEALPAAQGQGAAERTEGEQAALEKLTRQMMTAAKYENLNDLYPELQEPQLSFSDQFPEKFDLREFGLVTPVKDQSPWGTCWAFGSMAASESSILSGLGLTTSEYAEKYGEEMDLSEKHLAYFVAAPLPDNSDQRYPFPSSQAGEGYHIVEGVDRDLLDFGGFFSLATSTLASGVGILKAKFAPYQSREGTLETTDDWSLPEEKRFGQS